MRKLSKAQLNTLIDQNPSMFRSGGSFTSNRLCKIFDIRKPSTKGRFETVNKRLIRFNLEKVTAYTSLNKLLARRGLVIRQSNNRYIVQDLEGTRNRIMSYSQQSAKKISQRRTLIQGLRTYQGRWSRLSDNELNTIRLSYRS